MKNKQYPHEKVTITHRFKTTPFTLNYLRLWSSLWHLQQCATRVIWRPCSEPVMGLFCFGCFAFLLCFLHSSLIVSIFLGSIWYWGPHNTTGKHIEIRFSIFLSDPINYILTNSCNMPNVILFIQTDYFSIILSHHTKCTLTTIPNRE